MAWEPHWQFWQRMTAPAPAPEPEPEPVAPDEPTPWAVQKQMNRLQRRVEQIESRRWVPRLPYRLNGQAKRAIAEARELLTEAGQVLNGGA
jgi:hypothetical protein